MMGTGKNLICGGSIFIDAELLKYEDVRVVNSSSGSGFETYAISREKGLRVIQINERFLEIW